jgi:hypothetical protein
MFLRVDAWCDVSPVDAHDEATRRHRHDGTSRRRGRDRAIARDDDACDDAIDTDARVGRRGGAVDDRACRLGESVDIATSIVDAVDARERRKRDRAT